jgi:hypothetical protein
MRWDRRKRRRFEQKVAKEAEVPVFRRRMLLGFLGAEQSATLHLMRRGKGGSLRLVATRNAIVGTRRSESTIGGGTPDITVGRADADQAGARFYLLAHYISKKINKIFDMSLKEI